MTRKNRLKLDEDGVFYHVMAKTVMSAMLFNTDRLKDLIFNRILYLSRCYYVDIHAIAIMTNHYHIVLSTRKPMIDYNDIKLRLSALRRSCLIIEDMSEDDLSEAYTRLIDLSEFMKDLNQFIAKIVNQERDNKGHVLGGRFKSVLLEGKSALLRCIAYVELNPVKAGLCDAPSEYKWCTSGRYYLNGKVNVGITIPDLTILDQVSKKAKPQRLYAFINQIAASRSKDSVVRQDDSPFCDLEEDINLIESLIDHCFKKENWAINSLILGGKAFCQRLISKLKLQTFETPKPFQISDDLFNAKQRVGPFLN